MVIIEVISMLFHEKVGEISGGFTKGTSNMKGIKRKSVSVNLNHAIMAKNQISCEIQSLVHWLNYSERSLKSIKS